MPDNVPSAPVDSTALLKVSLIDDTKPEQPELPSLLQQLESAVRNYEIDVVARLVAQGADPNEAFEYNIGRKKFTGTVLTLALQLGVKNKLITALLDAHADPSSTYTFPAGLEEVMQKAPAASGALVRRQFGTFRLLAERKAVLHGRTFAFDDEPNGTLLYEACYIGWPQVVRFLLKKARCRQDLEVAVKFQDDLSLEMTPLHVAARQGHCEVCEDLLKDGATIASNDKRGRGPPPLADAVDMCHVDVVRLLVKYSADIFEGEPGSRGFDFILNTDNSIIIAAAASGLLLSQNESVVRKMQTADLVAFLLTANAEEALEAIFRPKVIRYWEGRCRKEHRTAYVLGGAIKLNIAIGPDEKFFTDLFFNRMAAKKRTARDESQTSQADARLTDFEKEFADELLTAHHMNNTIDRSIQRVPIETCQCVLPSVHDDVEVVAAIARGPNYNALRKPCFQAVIMHGWRQAEYRYRNTFIANLALAVLFSVVSVLLRTTPSDATNLARLICGAVMTLLFLRNAFLELMQICGLIFLGHGKSYFENPGNLLDIGRLLISGVSIVLVFLADQLQIASGESPILLLFVALTIWFRWTRVLYSARGFEQTGQIMLPILNAVGSTWPFLGVVICPLIGFFNCYYMLGVRDAFASFMIVYRIAFLGDFDLEEMEAIDPTFHQSDTDPSILEVVDAEKTNLHVVISLFLVVLSIFFTVVLMNILIGVVGESYNAQYAERDKLFLQVRADLIFEHMAVDKAIDRIFGCGRRKRRQISPSEDEKRRYIWFCRAKNNEEMGVADEEDDEPNNPANVHERVNMVLAELSVLKQAILASSELGKGETNMDEMAPRLYHKSQ